MDFVAVFCGIRQGRGYSRVYNEDNRSNGECTASMDARRRRRPAARTLTATSVMDGHCTVLAVTCQMNLTSAFMRERISNK